MIYEFNYQFYDFIRFISWFIFMGMMLGDIMPKFHLKSTHQFLVDYLK